MNDHHFNVRVAIDFDPETAIFLNSMAFWLNIRAANREHYYEGHYWLYNSYTQWSEIFPYWSSKQMRRIIDNAVNSRLLMKGSFNLKRYDNTNWYTFTDKALAYYPLLKEQLLNTPAQTGKTPAQTGKTPAQTGRPIPYTKPVSNPDRELTTNCQDSSSSSFFFSQTLDKTLLLQRLPRDKRTDEEFLTHVKEHVDKHSDKNFARMQRAQGALRLLKKLKEQDVIFYVAGKEPKDEEITSKPLPSTVSDCRNIAFIENELKKMADDPEYKSEHLEDALGYERKREKHQEGYKSKYL